MITWDDFVRDFRAAHIPSGLMERKREEFLSLRQDHRSVQEYNLEFVRLARYAPEEVSTEAKRIARFRKGLSTEIKYALTQCNPELFLKFVDDAIRQESAKADLDAERKRQREFSSAAMVHKKQKAWVPDAPLQRHQFSSLALALHQLTRGSLRRSQVSFATSVVCRGTTPPSAQIHVLLSCHRLHLALLRAMRW